MSVLIQFHALKSNQYKPLSYISRTKNREKKIQAAAFISDFTVIYFPDIRSEIFKKNDR